MSQIMKYDWENMIVGKYIEDAEELKKIKNEILVN